MTPDYRVTCRWCSRAFRTPANRGTHEKVCGEQPLPGYLHAVIAPTCRGTVVPYEANGTRVRWRCTRCWAWCPAPAVAS